MDPLEQMPLLLTADVSPCQNWSAGLQFLTLYSGGEKPSAPLPIGVLKPTGLDWEPFGEKPYLELVNLFAEQALALGREGAQCIVADEMTSLGESRAALMGARQTGLPVWVLLSVDEEGITDLGAELLASLLTLQSMGAALVGFFCRGDPAATLRLLERVSPYATAPLLVRLQTQSSGEALEAGAAKALRAGADVLFFQQALQEEQWQALRLVIQNYDPAQREIAKDRESVLAACAHLPFFLHRDHLECSQPILCTHDMSAAIIEAENAGCTLIRVSVESIEEARMLGLNTHMFRVPVCILANREEVLDAALLYFSGRAILDSLSEVPHETLLRLAQGYGAILL